MPKGPGKNWQSNANGSGEFYVQISGGVPRVSRGMVRIGIETDIARADFVIQ